MKSALKLALVSLGVATVSVGWIADPLVRADHKVLYHWSASPLQLFGPVLLDILLVWAFAALLLASARRGAWRQFVWMSVILLAPWFAIKSLSLLEFITLSHWLSVCMLGLALAVPLVSVVFLRHRYHQPLEGFLDFGSTILAFVAISGLIWLGQLLWTGWQARLIDQAFASAPRQAPPSASKAKVIWIIFDELSYQQVYGHRFEGISLPAFDALAKQATVFTHVVPAGLPIDRDIRTEKIVPALLMGRQVEDVRSSATGELSFRDAEDHPWQPFNQNDTVFGDARSSGYKTAVVGWFNPYCRILSRVLDECFWTSRMDLGNGMVPYQSDWRNALAPFAKLLHGESSDKDNGHNRESDSATRERASHLVDYKDLLAKAEEVTDDPSIDFVLLHLPIPHPLGIYDRRSGSFTTGGSTYLDNLVLTDRCLAELRARLERRGQWDSTNVLVMGDHSWRTDTLWSRIPEGWAVEEQRASTQGAFDSRPAYIFKAAGQQQGTQHDAPFQALGTRALLDRIFAESPSQPKQGSGTQPQ